MEAVQDFLGFLWQAAAAVLDAFGRAVAEHPLVTLLCYAAAAWLFLRRAGRLEAARSGRLMARMGTLDWIEALAFFIITTLLARAVGVVVNAAIDLLVWAVNAVVGLVSVGANVTGEVASPFREAPVAYLAALMASLLVATVWLRLRARREAPAAARGVGRGGMLSPWLSLRGLAAAAACLVVTYVVATVAATLNADAPASPQTEVRSP